MTEGQLNATFPAYATPESQAQHNAAAAARGEEPWPPLPALMGGGVPGHPCVVWWALAHGRVLRSVGRGAHYLMQRRIDRYRNFTRASIQPLSPNEPRRLRFPLLPVSYEFGVGHSVRLTLRLADVDLFQEACGAAAATHAMQCAVPGEEPSATSTTNPVTSVSDGGSGASVDRVWVDESRADDCDDDADATDPTSSTAPSGDSEPAAGAANEAAGEATVASDGATSLEADGSGDSGSTAEQPAEQSALEALAVAAASNSATLLRGLRLDGNEDGSAELAHAHVSRIELPIIRRR